MFVNEGVERHSVTPAGGEVVDVDIWIAAKKHRSRLAHTISLIMQTAVAGQNTQLTLPSSSDTTEAERL